MERVAQVVEEGTKFMMGETAQMGGQGNEETTASNPIFDSGDEDIGEGIYDNIEGMEDVHGSPLMGMAENVMSDIMS